MESTTGGSVIPISAHQQPNLPTLSAVAAAAVNAPLLPVQQSPMTTIAEATPTATPTTTAPSLRLESLRTARRSPSKEVHKTKDDRGSKVPGKSPPPVLLSLKSCSMDTRKRRSVSVSSSAVSSSVSRSPTPTPTKLDKLDKLGRPVLTAAAEKGGTRVSQGRPMTLSDSSSSPTPSPLPVQLQEVNSSPPPTPSPFPAGEDDDGDQPQDISMERKMITLPSPKGRGHEGMVSLGSISSEDDEEEDEEVEDKEEVFDFEQEMIPDRLSLSPAPPAATMIAPPTTSKGFPLSKADDVITEEVATLDSGIAGERAGGRGGSPTHSDDDDDDDETSRDIPIADGSRVAVGGDSVVIDDIIREDSDIVQTVVGDRDVLSSDDDIVQSSAKLHQHSSAGAPPPVVTTAMGISQEVLDVLGTTISSDDSDEESEEGSEDDEDNGQMTRERDKESTQQGSRDVAKEMMIKTPVSGATRKTGESSQQVNV